MCPLFLKSTDDVLAPRLSAVFRRLVRLGRIPACWIQANVTKIPKGPSYSSVANYRPISIPSVSSKVFVRLVSVRLGDLWNAVVHFKPPGLFIENVRVPVMHFDACPIHYKGHWRVDRRLGSRRMSSVQPLKLRGQTIWEFYISYVLWVLEVLHSLY